MKGADLGPDASGRPYSSLVLRRLLTRCWARRTGLATLLMGCTTASLADCSDCPRDRPDLDAAGVGRYGTRGPAGGHPGRGTAARIGARVERLLAFFLPFAGYLSVAVLLDLVYHSVVGDATSREANAYYVFFSNDPHLAAIGFVWNPLTSLTEMPLILLKGLWPALTAEAFASGIMSSVFMAGNVLPVVPLHGGTRRQENRPLVAGSRLRRQPDDRVLRRQRDERGAVPVHPRGHDPLLGAVAGRGARLAIWSSQESGWGWPTPIAMRRPWPPWCRRS